MLPTQQPTHSRDSPIERILTPHADGVAAQEGPGQVRAVGERPSRTHRQLPVGRGGPNEVRRGRLRQFIQIRHAGTPTHPEARIWRLLGGGFLFNPLLRRRLHRE